MFIWALLASKVCDWLRVLLVTFRKPLSTHEPQVSRLTLHSSFTLIKAAGSGWLSLKKTPEHIWRRNSRLSSAMATCTLLIWKLQGSDPGCDDGRAPLMSSSGRETRVRCFSSASLMGGGQEVCALRVVWKPVIHSKDFALLSPQDFCHISQLLPRLVPRDKTLRLPSPLCARIPAA